MASNSKVANSKDVTEKFPLISKAILAGASPQIRNMASSAGNLLQRTRCPYFSILQHPATRRKPNSGCSAIDGANRMSAVADIIISVLRFILQIFVWLWLHWMPPLPLRQKIRRN
jgi:xanthine dehydrogenase YagS FAD-binding subunit